MWRGRKEGGGKGQSKKGAKATVVIPYLPLQQLSPYGPEASLPLKTLSGIPGLDLLHGLRLNQRAAGGTAEVGESLTPESPFPKRVLFGPLSTSFAAALFSPPSALFSVD